MISWIEPSCCATALLKPYEDAVFTITADNEVMTERLLWLPAPYFSWLRELK